MLRARIDRLPSACIEVLKLASVLGESFALPLLRDVCEPSGDVDKGVAELVSAGLLHELGDGEIVRFKHAIVRDVAYEMLLLQRRRELHGAVGCAIERSEAIASTSTSNDSRITSRAATTATRRCITW